ncbi:MAG: excinuclease ABC subunit UvrC [Elusimicrobia bacterium]|nr:excinuclease ABC subunit UvrC [Elusimicrobiota bacterium]
MSSFSVNTVLVQAYQSLPSGPGVYLMREAAGRIIYIGKAKNLKKRVSSYFQKTDVGPKIQALLSVVRHIDYTPCQSEREALVLEEAWIKKFQPVFNAMWKDDKSYPYAVVTMGEDFPRLYLARKKQIPPGALIFGPYPNVSRIKGLIRALFRSGRIALRPCRWDFSQSKPLDPKKINSCLYYHTGQCPAPCAGKINLRDYRKIAQKAVRLFGGNRPRLLAGLRREMKASAKKLRFEAAQKIKNEIEAMEHIQEKVMVSEVTAAELGGLYNPERAIRRLAEVLGLDKKPRHIEGFDNSNLFGTNAVASSVCFLEGKPNKDHYRHYRIKMAAGIDDFAMMREVVGRRLMRLVTDKEELPGLLLIDGGPGQLSAARKAMDSAWLFRAAKVPGTIPSTVPALVSLAKREEILYLDRDSGAKPQKIRLPKSDEALKLCMWIRDEAHRFAITYHRKRRSGGVAPP